MREMLTETEPQPISICWKTPESDSDFIPAYDYLTLFASPGKADNITDRLQEVERIVYRLPLTILRAAGLNPLHNYDRGVQNIIRRAGSKKEILMPILVTSRDNTRIHVADGYEAISASYWINKDRAIPAVITKWDSE